MREKREGQSHGEVKESKEHKNFQETAALLETAGRDVLRVAGAEFYAIHSLGVSNFGRKTFFSTASLPENIFFRDTQDCEVIAGEAVKKILKGEDDYSKKLVPQARVGKVSGNPGNSTAYLDKDGSTVRIRFLIDTKEEPYHDTNPAVREISINLNKGKANQFKDGGYGRVQLVAQLFSTIEEARKWAIEQTYKDCEGISSIDKFVEG